MRVKLGVVGAADSVNLISNVAEEFKNIHLICLPYEHVNEAEEIVQNNEHQIDVWLFAGQIPYTLAKKSITKQAFHLKLNGSSISNTLFKISYHGQNKIDKVSIDTIDRIETLKTFQELHLSTESLHLYPYKGAVPLEEIFQFHTRLYYSGRVDYCITCVNSVYEKLHRHEIPVYRLTPARVNISTGLSIIQKEVEAIHLMRSRLMIQIIEVDMKPLFDEITSYEIHRLSLRLQDAILYYTEAIEASFTVLGNGKYMIFSNKGAIEDEKHHPAVLLDQIARLTDLKTNIGIGFGETALSAEKNAQLALKHAINYESFCVYSVDENNKVEGPLQDTNRIQFSYRTLDPHLISKLEESSVSIATFNKLLSIQQKNGEQITPNQIAESLNMTKRNARRILSNLETQELVEVIGIESPHSRGRPGRMYRIKYPEE